MPDEKRMYLLFKVRETVYGFELPFVDEVIQLPELTCIAKMQNEIAGFLNLRQEIICVIDMPVTLGYSATKYSLDDYVIILKYDSLTFGVIVSEILDINELDVSEEVETEFEQKKATVHPLVSTIARFNDDIVFILDPPLIYKKLSQIYQEMGLDKGVLKTDQTVAFNISPGDRAIFLGRAQALAKKLVEVQKKNVMPLTVIHINQEYFGVDPEIIKEFTRIEDFTPVPTSSAPSYLLGFINVRGEILTLIDLWQVLKNQKLEMKKSSKILVVTVHDLIVGILVDDILDIIFVKPEEFRAVPLGMQKAHDEFIKHTVLYEKDVLGVLNLTKVVESIMHVIEPVDI